MILNFGTQYEQVSIGNPCPIETSAILQINSTMKGFLPPRMDEAARDLIAAPASGLVIYNTDSKCLDYFDGVKWVHIGTKITNYKNINLSIGTNLINTLYNSSTNKHEVRARYGSSHSSCGSEIILKKKDISTNSFNILSVINLNDVDIYCTSMEF